MPVKVFISYSHDDQELHKKLREHLSPLERSGKITIWQDQEIPAGANWEGEINTHLNEADLILLLVSSSFIASNYCWNREVQTALQRHRTGTVQVIPIILRPVDWKETPLGELQALPTKAKPVTAWDDVHTALSDVVRGTRNVVSNLEKRSRVISSSIPSHSEPVTPTADHPNLVSDSGQTFPLPENGSASPDIVVQDQPVAITAPSSLPNTTPLPETSPVPFSPPRQRRLPVRVSRRQALLAGLLILVLGSSLLAGWLFLHPPTPPFILPNAVKAVQAPDGKLIGLSDGKYVFDTTSPAADLKEQAAQKLQEGDTGSAISLLSAAHNQETNDAEVLIYRENIRATSGGNYITLVVGTTLTGTASAIGIGHDVLQGAYVAQREFNDTAEQHGGTKVRLLIANSGGKTDDDTASYTSLVAQQIVGVAQQEKIVGVMGWNLSALTFAALTPLTQAHIPMVSTAAGDNFTRISKYFFRATAPAALQAKVAAQYSLQTIKATSAAIFVDNANEYSRSLADDFRNNFGSGNGGTIVATESYTVGDANTQPAQLEAKLRDALQHHPDIIYFAGYPPDVSVLLQQLQPSDPPVMGGNALYEIEGGAYTHVTSAGLSHLRFSALTYPDEWEFLGLSAQKPAFFDDYALAFGPVPSGKSPYGYTRADSGTVLDHDATMAFLQASEGIAKGSLTPDQMQQALAGLTGSNALQGVAGQLAFGSDGNPINKAVTIVCNKDGFFKLDVVVGQFLVNGPILTEYPAKSVCA